MSVPAQFDFQTAFGICRIHIGQDHVQLGVESVLNQTPPYVMIHAQIFLTVTVFQAAIVQEMMTMPPLKLDLELHTVGIVKSTACAPTL